MWRTCFYERASQAGADLAAHQVIGGGGRDMWQALARWSYFAWLGRKRRIVVRMRMGAARDVFRSTAVGARHSAL